MKKYILIIIIILLTGCTDITINKKDFKEKADFNGYYIENTLEEYKNYSNVVDVYYAINKDNTYLIQFLELSDDDYAKKFYNLNKKLIEDNKETNSYIKEQNKLNYNLYHVETDNYYMLVIRCYNNIIYINAPIEYINEIEDFLNDLNLVY